MLIGGGPLEFGNEIPTFWFVESEQTFWCPITWKIFEELAFLNLEHSLLKRNYEEGTTVFSLLLLAC